MTNDQQMNVVRPAIGRLIFFLFLPVSVSFASCANSNGSSRSVAVTTVAHSAGDDQTSLRSEQRPPATANQLRDAVRSGNLNLVRSLLSENPELANTPDTDSDSRYPALHWAVIDGYVEIARLLLENGAKVNERDQRHGMTPIFHASSGEMAKLLLDHGAEYKLRAKDSDQTPFREAVSGRYMEVVKIFLDLGEKLEFDDAVTLGQTELVATMLKEKPWLAKPPRKPLHSAAGQGNLELSKLLLEHGADPNLDYGFSNVIGPYTPLSDAVTDGQYEIAKLLLEHGANPNVSGGRNHDNLFLFAIAYLDARFVKLMLENNADVHAGDHWGHAITPLHVAVALGGAKDAGHIQRWGQPESPEKDKFEVMQKVKLLLEFGADVNARTEDGSTPLLFAAIADHQIVCDLLLEQGATLDIYSACLLEKRARLEEMLKESPEVATAKEHPLHRTLLHWAARSGALAFVERLLELGADPNAKAPSLSYQDAGGFSVWERDKEEGETPLHVAARHGHEEIARHFIQKGANVDATTDRDATPLSYACSGGHEKVVKLLLERGAKVNFDKHGWLFYSTKNNLHIFRLLVDACGKAELTGQLGTDLLASAVEWERRDAVDLLLARGAKPDIFTASILGRTDDVRKLIELERSLVKAVQSDYPRESPIVLAAQNGHADVVELLVTNGAEIEPSKLGGKSLLHEAAEHGQQNVIDLLLKRGLTLDARADEGATLLHAAAGGAQPEIVQFLLSNGAEATACNFSRETPLHEVAGWRPFHDKNKADPDVIERVLAVARLLIDAGTDVNARDKNGWTPLHRAASYGSVELSELLIAAGAEVNARNHRDETPLNWCESHRRFGFSDRDPKPVADLLRRHGGVR